MRYWNRTCHQLDFSTPQRVSYQCWNSSHYRNCAEDGLDHIRVQPEIKWKTWVLRWSINKPQNLRSSSTLEERITVIVYNVQENQSKYAEADQNWTNGGALTVEILTIQLLNELKHHPMSSPQPQLIPRGETFRPSRFPSFIFSIDGKVQFFNSLLHQRIVERNPIQQANDDFGFFAPLVSE